MDLLEGIASRRSAKSFKPDSVPEDVIRKILEAGLWAPSGQNLQPVRFWVITEAAVLKETEEAILAMGRRLQKMLPLLRLCVPQFKGEKGARVFKSLREGMFHGAPALVLVGADRNSSSTYAKDCTLAAMNMMLASHSLGVGACYIGWTTLVNRLKGLKAKLNIPGSVEIVDGVVIGYTDSDRRAPSRKPLDDVTTWVDTGSAS